MASTLSASSKTPLTKFYEGLVYLYPFSVPTPRIASADYKSSFKSYMKSSEDTKMFIEGLDESRQSMLNLIASGGHLNEQIALLDIYLGEASSLYESLIVAMANKQVINCDKEMAFEWNLYLNNRPPFRSPSLIFEIIMLTHMKAMLHYQLARQLLAADVASFATEAGKHLLQSASLLDLIATNLTSLKWERRFNSKEVNPPECTARACMAVSTYCKGRAQAVALVKALNENKISLSVRCRLSLGVASLSEQTLVHLAESVPPYMKADQWMYHILTAAAASDREIARALANYYLAVHCGDDNLPGGKQVGQAITCSAVCKALLAEQRCPIFEYKIPGLPRISQHPYTALAHLKDVVTYITTQLSEVDTVWDRENRLIYFQSPPRTVDDYAVPLPAEAVVANPPSAVEATPRCIPFIDPPKPKSVFSGLLRGFSTSSSSVATTTTTAAGSADGAATTTVEASSAPPLTADMMMHHGDGGNSVGGGSGLSDEEFARELQRRLDLESSNARK